MRLPVDTSVAAFVRRPGRSEIDSTPGQKLDAREVPSTRWRAERSARPTETF